MWWKRVSHNTMLPNNTQWNQIKELTRENVSMVTRLSFSLLWCRHIRNQPQEDLGRFDYMIRKYFKNSVLVSWPAGAGTLNLANLVQKPFLFGDFIWKIILKKKPFTSCMSCMALKICWHSAKICHKKTIVVLD